jgi:hypothetical protein
MFLSDVGDRILATGIPGDFFVDAFRQVDGIWTYVTDNLNGSVEGFPKLVTASLAVVMLDDSIANLNGWW